MLSRGKLVQDWNRRLAAAEAEGAQKHSLKWLYQMRVRLYRFLLSCYRQGDWRADEPSITADKTLADVPHGDTTTILDCPLDGKPAKTTGKMQAVLKSVSAAQDHPAEAGPLLGGIAADEWVVAISVRDKLNMETCGKLLERYGISAVNTAREIKVRHCDLGRADDLIKKAHSALKIRQVRLPFPLMVGKRNANVSRSARIVLALAIMGPIYAVGIWIFTSGIHSVFLESENLDSTYYGIVLIGLAIGSYLLGASIAGLQIHVWHFRRIARQLQEWRRSWRFSRRGRIVNLLLSY